MGRSLTRTTLALLAAAPAALAADQAGLWTQCGGNGWTGPTQCVSGAYCMVYNDWYYQCIPGQATTTAAPSSTLTTVTRTSSAISTASSTSTSGPKPDDCSVQFLITFGDSYSQTGFDVNGGLNWVGFLASQYNRSTLLTYNFAYGGATTNATIVPPFEPTVLSFVDQVAQFSGSIANKPSYAPWGDNALFGVWIGVNDVGNAWWKPDYDQVLEQIMATYFGQLQILYNAGARNFVLLTVPPIHRTPAVLEGSDESQQQVEAAAIAKYNDALTAGLAAFTTKNTGITSKIVDTTAPFNTALDNPTKYGSPDATCYNGDGKSCLWFNDYHPGIEINRLVAEAVAGAWKGSYF
ncbi:hypothetical protein B0I37DRAFT_415545 [Chaetomium sp. MPI-CAGE-AT-0009]|nr:hypothetical protein B0I37DRAFT_415545 [Chaetomium sp. MPI-CAGE-AT-0009]